MMDTPPQTVADATAQKVAKVDRLKRQLELAQMELDIWLEAVALAEKLYGGKSQPPDSPPAVRQAPPSVGDAHQGRRPMMPAFRAMLAEVAAAHPLALDFDQIGEILARHGRPSIKSTIRSICSVYARDGLLERAGNGRYRATQKGADEAGVVLGVSEVMRLPAPEAESIDDPDLGAPDEEKRPVPRDPAWDL
jgi:hypothetical protein